MTSQGKLPPNSLSVNPGRCGAIKSRGSSTRRSSVKLIMISRPCEVKSSTLAADGSNMLPNKRRVCRSEMTTEIPGFGHTLFVRNLIQSRPLLP